MDYPTSTPVPLVLLKNLQKFHTSLHRILAGIGRGLFFNNQQPEVQVRLLLKPVVVNMLLCTLKVLKSAHALSPAKNQDVRNAGKQ